MCGGSIVGVKFPLESPALDIEGLSANKEKNDLIKISFWKKKKKNVEEIRVCLVEELKKSRKKFR